MTTALAFLIVHPSMYQNIQAQAEPEYDFSRYVGSITPELEPEGYGLNPFYAGRPLYDPYSATMDGGIVAFILGLAAGYRMLLGIAGFFAVAYLIYQAARAVWDGINWLIEMKYRKYFKDWLVNIVQQYGPIGGTECVGKEGRGQEFVDCIEDEHKKLFRAFTDQARKCDGGRWEGRQQSRSILRGNLNVSFKFKHFVGTHWACHEYYKKNLIGILTPYWDASPWL